uniref:Uncharacterized protein n=1 Tax=Tetranychus urticae TaxID=32264 RepID=T1KUQ6_TETUR
MKDGPIILLPLIDDNTELPSDSFSTFCTAKMTYGKS